MFGRFHAAEWKTALPWPQSSSRYRLALSHGGTLQPLRSSPMTEPSSLLRAAPPLCPASVLGSLRFLPLGRLPWQRDDRFSRSIQEPDPASRRLHAGCRSGGLQDSPRTDPGELDDPPGFDIIFGISTRHQRFAFARLSGSYLTGLRSRLWLQRSPRSLLTAAACRGLRPAPDCRPRGANPHLLYSSTSPPSEMCS